MRVRGNYIEKNEDLKLSYYLSTKYTIKENIRVREMCTYLQSDAFQQTWEEYKQTRSKWVLFQSHITLKCYSPWALISQLLPPWLPSKTQRWYTVGSGSQGYWMPKHLSFEDLLLVTKISRECITLQNPDFSLYFVCCEDEMTRYVSLLHLLQHRESNHYIVFFSWATGFSVQNPCKVPVQYLSKG